MFRGTFATVLRLFLLLSLGTLTAHAISEAPGYRVKWMWGDAGFAGSHALARQNSWRWSAYKTVKEAIADLQEEERVGRALGGSSDNRRRPVDIMVKSDFNDAILVDTKRSSLFDAINMLRKWKHEDTANQEKQRIKEESTLRRHLVQWMWGDAGIVKSVAELNPLRWSTWKSPEETIAELRNESPKKRPVNMSVKRIYGDDIYDDGQPRSLYSGNVAEAVRNLQDLSGMECETSECMRPACGAAAIDEIEPLPKLEVEVLGNVLSGSIL